MSASLTKEQIERLRVSLVDWFEEDKEILNMLCEMALRASAVEPEEVREVVADLREDAGIFDHDTLMKDWDAWRGWIKAGEHGTLPTDCFRSLIDEMPQRLNRAADLLERLSAAGR